MNERLDDVFSSWWAAERAGRDGDAERALARLFCALPVPAPAADFAGRVLARAGLQVVAASYPWWGRAAVAACLLTAGLATAFVLPLVLGLTRLVAPGEAVATLVAGFVAVASRIDEALALWQSLAAVADTVALVATAPPVVLALLTLAALSAFTFRGLSELLTARRSPEHVQA